eukprot:5935591-Amphidinium_carterae.1
MRCSPWSGRATPLKLWLDSVSSTKLWRLKLGFWPESLRDLLLLQLPKAGAVNAGERRPIALMP